MTTIKVGVREFRERIAKFLESENPVAVTRHGETVGVYIPTKRKRPKTAGGGRVESCSGAPGEAVSGRGRRGSSR